jgi:hypothetical protein
MLFSAAVEDRLALLMHFWHITVQKVEFLHAKIIETCITHELSNYYACFCDVLYQLFMNAKKHITCPKKCEDL